MTKIKTNGPESLQSTSGVFFPFVHSRLHLLPHHWAVFLSVHTCSHFSSWFPLAPWESLVNYCAFSTFPILIPLIFYPYPTSPTRLPYTESPIKTNYSASHRYTRSDAFTCLLLIIHDLTIHHEDGRFDRDQPLHVGRNTKAMVESSLCVDLNTVWSDE